MTDKLTVKVRFPDGERDMPAFQCPDHAMYAGMPGEYILTPSPIPGYSTERTSHNYGRDHIWVATPIKKTKVDELDLSDYIPSRIRVAPIFPNNHVTGAQIEQFVQALTARGVNEQLYRIEAVVIYDKSVDREVQEASYDLGDLVPSRR